MDFESAVNLSPKVEAIFPDVVVVGVRRMSFSRQDSWALDLINPKTGQMITLDEKDAWEQRLQEIVAQGS